MALAPRLRARVEEIDLSPMNSAEGVGHARGSTPQSGKSVNTRTEVALTGSRCPKTSVRSSAVSCRAIPWSAVRAVSGACEFLDVGHASDVKIKQEYVGRRRFRRRRRRLRVHRVFLPVPCVLCGIEKPGCHCLPSLRLTTAAKLPPPLCAEEAAMEPIGHEAIASFQRLPPKRADPVRILVFSDDANVREQVKSALGKRIHPELPELTYIDVATGPMVIQKVEEGKIDIAILDGDAAPYGGMGIANQLKDEMAPRPSIVVLTRLAADSWLATWSRAEAIVPRPIDPFTLADAVVALIAPEIGARRRPPPNVTRAGPAATNQLTSAVMLRLRPMQGCPTKRAVTRSTTLQGRTMRVQLSRRCGGCE